MSGSLNQVWGMINGLQLIVHLPAVNVNFPTNVMVVSEEILKVATFDIPFLDTQNITTLLNHTLGMPILESPDSEVPFEEQGDLAERIDQLGYGSSYLTTNLGTMFLMIVLTFLGFCSLIVLWPLNKIKRINKLRVKLDRNLKWNFTIRLFLEGLLETTFSAFITLKFASTTTFGGKLNYFMAICLLTITIALPIFIVLFYLKNHDRMCDPDDEKFEQ